jgi:general stress protein 26
MQSYLPLNFLQERINTLQTALFFSMSASVLKFPVSVINVLTVDEAGQIWFCMPAPIQSIKEFDDEFHSMLQFFRKDENFYLKIQGKAFIINDPEQISNIFFVNDGTKKDILRGRFVLIKVQMQYADYFERKQRAEKSAPRNIPAQLYNLLFKPYEVANKPQRIFNLSH